MSVKEKIQSLGWQGWNLYDKPGATSAANALSDELIVQASVAFAELAQLDKTIVQVAREVNTNFNKYKSQFADFGTDDTEVNEITERLISDLFNVPFIHF